MKKLLPVIFILLVTLGSAISAAAAVACPDVIITSGGRECTLTGTGPTGSCYYSCS